MNELIDLIARVFTLGAIETVTNQMVLLLLFVIIWYFIIRFVKGVLDV